MIQVSIIVPVRNEGRCIQATLAALAHQEFPPEAFEVLVIDGCSTDDTVAQVRGMRAVLPNLRLFHNPARLASAARNIGLIHARGDYIVIVDGHCTIRDPHFVQRLVAAFASSGADTLGRPQPLNAPDATPYQQAVAAARASWLGHNPDSAIFSSTPRFVPPDNVAVAYRRAVIERVGFFDESFDACEDVEFNTRVRQAGFNCFFTPDIAVEYHPRKTFRALAYQMARYGRGRARLAGKHPTSVTAASLVPPLSLLCAAVLAVAAPWNMAARISLAAAALAYAAVITLEAWRLARRQPTLSVPRLASAFLAIHLGFACGYWREWARLRTWRTWFGHFGQLVGRITTTLVPTLARHSSAGGPSLAASAAAPPSPPIRSGRHVIDQAEQMTEPDRPGEQRRIVFATQDIHVLKT